MIALPIVPKRVREEIDGAKHYYRKGALHLLRHRPPGDRTGVRVVAENDLFISLAPYAPRFPFETWLLPKRHGSAFEDNQSPVYANLAWVLKDNLMRIDPCWTSRLQLHHAHLARRRGEHDHYHWHIEIMPKLTKVAGFEWGTGFYINPTPPEESARFLREAHLGVQR